MSRIYIKRLLVAAILSLGGIGLVAPAAQAQVDVDFGPYHVAMGFGTEPACAAR